MVPWRRLPSGLSGAGKPRVGPRCVSITLVLPDPITNDLIGRATSPDESAGVLLARRHRTAHGDTRLLGRALYWAPPQAYLHRSPTAMSITPEGYVRALGLAERDSAIAIWVHTHPLGNPLPSKRDKIVDSDIADVFRLRSGSDYYGTLIAAPSASCLDLTGTLEEDGMQAEPIDRFWLVGDRWRLQRAFDAKPNHATITMFDRNVRALSKAVQQTIGMLKIAVVGAGGTGSAVAEQLVRLGARELVILDADTLSESNVTRVYGSTIEHVGRPKVTVLREYLKRIAPDLRCKTIYGFCTQESVARELTSVDLIFGCTDDNAGRLVLSRLSTYYLIPVIDIGILLSSHPDGELIGIDGRVTILSPGNACLLCRQRVDTTRAAAEMKTPQERIRLADEGYAPALEGVEPSVVPYTTMVASTALTEMLERLVGYGHAQRPSEVLLRIHDREISTNIVQPNPRHYCASSQNKWGAGDTVPFIEQTWAE